MTNRLKIRQLRKHEDKVHFPHINQENDTSNPPGFWKVRSVYWYLNPSVSWVLDLEANFWMIKNVKTDLNVYFVIHNQLHFTVLISSAVTNHHTKLAKLFWETATKQKDQKCIFTDLAIPDNASILLKQKITKYKNLEIDISRMGKGNHTWSTEQSRRDLRTSGCGSAGR